MLMVRAGSAVDDTIAQLEPLLEPATSSLMGATRIIWIPCGGFPNSRPKAFCTSAQASPVEKKAHSTVHPSCRRIGSSLATYQAIFQAIAAKVDDGSPCCDWVGPGGAGHFVKMVHNGIEYGDMQLISEVYHLMRNQLNMTPDEMAEVFDTWDKGELDSYLISITSDILRYKEEDGSPLIDKILDAAGQKGTGKWTGITALDFSVPVTLIVEAVFARCLSAMKDERVGAAKLLGKPSGASFDGERAAFIDDLGRALYAAKIFPTRRASCFCGRPPRNMDGS